VKLPQALLLVTVILRLFCVHAGAATIARTQVNGGDGTVTMTWNSRRIPASHPVTAADASNQFVPNPGVSLDARVRLAAGRCNPRPLQNHFIARCSVRPVAGNQGMLRQRIEAQPRHYTFCRGFNSSVMPAGTAASDAAVWQPRLKTSIGGPPPAPGAPGKNGTPAFSCGTLDEDGYQMQASALAAALTAELPPRLRIHASAAQPSSQIFNPSL
jgi:hypothetical protein